MEIKKFIEFIGVFKIKEKSTHYEKLVPILNDIINDIQIEWNDFKLLCKELYDFNHEIFADFPYTFNNQQIVKDKIIDIYDMGEQ
jgi:hypothetical protein